MTEEETTERSAEILRLALPLMSKHAPGFQPVSYALWYEYAHGGNGALRTEVDEALRGEERLSWTRTQALYQRHLLDGAEQAFTRARADLISLLGKMQGSVKEAATDTSEFTATLDAFGEQLGRCGTVAEMQERVDSIMGEVRRVNGSLQQLDGDLVSSRSEIQRLSDALAKMREEADTDALTGLRNRRAFDRELARLAGEGDALGASSCLLMVDIDHFKRVNDTCGHLFGDRVLQGVARAIAATVKGRDLAARFGGEEFSVLLPGTDAAGAVCVAEQIREAVSGIRIRRAQSEQTIASVTVSVGVAQRAPGESFDGWFERADKALYKAKNNGRNRVEKAT